MLLLLLCLLLFNYISKIHYETDMCEMDADVRIKKKRAVISQNLTKEFGSNLLFRIC